ncbi:MAG: hypothetical protein K2P57_05650 [Burkholderiales bacterium]|nr:hypothetical protein [Burkholderiales bacterium]
MMRVKSRWFRGEREKSPQEIAGAMAFILWKIAQNALKNVRRADFYIEVGPQYFDFLAEFLIFLTQIADRIAYERLEEASRAAFTTELALRVAENLAENRDSLLGLPLGKCRSEFIDRLNERSNVYAEFGYGTEGPDFAFIRCLGHYILEHAQEKDKHWIVDQIVSVEAPDAVSTVQRAMRGLLDEES